MNMRSILFIILLTLTFYFTQNWFKPKKSQEQTQPVVKTEKIEIEPEEFSAEGEKFFVLENEYQQLVFSNIGGALAEINLPFTSTKDDKSVVHEINFDRKIKDNSPKNAYFPARPYSSISDNNTIEEHEKGHFGGYYPLIRRSVMSPKGRVQYHIPPRYYACSTLSQDKEQEVKIYQVTKFTKNTIEFVLEQNNRRITKTYTLPEKTAPYFFDLSIKVDGSKKNLFITSGIPEVELISGQSTPVLKYRLTKGQKNVVEKVSLPKETITVSSIYPDWVCNSNGFLGLILDPTNDTSSGYKATYVPGIIAPTRLSLISPEHNLYPSTKYPGYEIILPLKATSKIQQFRLFAGPYQTNILKIADDMYNNPVTGYNPEYIQAQTLHRWFSFISEPFSKFLFILMQFFHKITSSWGISIILLTIALRIMLYPLNAWTIKSKFRMQEVGPQVKALQNKYKKDPRKAQMEIMKLYKEKKANPLTGCLPIVIQMPFLFGMFDLLKSSFELRGVSFIPGWINNLTAPDVLFSWSHPIIFLGTEFHFLPLLLGIVMFIQQKMMSTLPKDKSQWTDQQKQQNMMGLVMPVVFTFLFYNFPSGLNIYWLSSMLLGILQEWLTTKRTKNKVEITLPTKK